MKTNRLLVVSFDALSSSDATQVLANCKNFSFLLKNGVLVKDVSSVFVTNTYPIHTSIITGLYPYKHGIIDNTYPVAGDKAPDWHWFSRDIKAPTLFDAAEKSGKRVANVMWPVMAKAKISYNAPEIFPNRFWKNQISCSLFNGSFLLQLKGAIKNLKELKSIHQPYIDNLSCALMCDMIKEKKPDLMLVHFTDADVFKHEKGINTGESEEAILRLDIRLGKLIDALKTAGIYDETNIIVLSDHGSLPIDKIINPNKLFLNVNIDNNGPLLTFNKKGYINNYRVWLKCSGGTAFLYLKNKSDKAALNAARKIIAAAIKSKTYGIRRFLTDEEMHISGYDREAFFGIEADYGVDLDELNKVHKGNHGYSLDNPDYLPFYLASGPDFKKGLTLSGGSLLDITPAMVSVLNLPKWEMDGKIKDILNK